MHKYLCSCIRRLRSPDCRHRRARCRFVGKMHLVRKMENTKAKQLVEKKDEITTYSNNKIATKDTFFETTKCNYLCSFFHRLQNLSNTDRRKIPPCSCIRRSGRTRSLQRFHIPRCLRVKKENWKEYGSDISKITQLYSGRNRMIIIGSEAFPITWRGFLPDWRFANPM